MSGFVRGFQVASPRRERVRETLSQLLCLEDVAARTRKPPFVYFDREYEIAQIFRERDPFGCDDPCPMNGCAPHHPVPTCGDLVCIHCSKVFW